jgi:carboxyl-terminal processing protease
MKDIYIVLAVLLSYPSVPCVAADGGTGTVDLHEVEAGVGQILERDHYTQRKLDSDMAEEILETYLERLDYNKLFFTQEDIDLIRSEYRSGLSDDILLGNLTSAKAIYAMFKQRVDQRVPKINGLLSRQYNFSSNRTVTVNRKKEPWPANPSDADRIWRDWIEKRLLDEKLSKSPKEPGPEVLGREYRELQNQIDHQDDEEVLRIFLEAVAQTYDPHSEYLGPSDLNEFKIDTQITISGIGVQIRVERGYATIVRIFPGGPAAHSGRLHIGDLIVGVAEGDGPFVNTVQTGRDKLTEMVLGKDGSVVHLQLISGHGEDPSKRRIVTLVRRKIRLTEEEAHAQLLERPTASGIIQKLGWITVPSFYGASDNSIKTTSITRDVTMLLKRLEREGIQGVVLDLRNNGGGSVDEAVQMIGLFIDQGPIAQLKDSDGAIHMVTGRPGKALYNGPMVVLDNKWTASASEIFSAAMQDYGRAVIVGDSSSFGKGTVQALIELGTFMHRLEDTANPAGALKITVEKVYRVNGESTQLKGVISDIAIPSLSDSEKFGESEQEHSLGYDEVTRIANNAAGGHKPLFLDELRSRSTKRINEEPVFHDLSAENQLITQKLRSNCVSLNEEARRNEIAEEVYLGDKGDADRLSANAHDRTRYYRLMLADVDKSELILINKKTELATTRKGEILDETEQTLTSLLPSESDFATATENDAITRETLNILSDVVGLNRIALMATHTESPR